MTSNWKPHVLLELLIACFQFLFFHDTLKLPSLRHKERPARRRLICWWIEPWLSLCTSDRKLPFITFAFSCVLSVLFHILRLVDMRSVCVQDGTQKINTKSFDTLQGMWRKRYPDWRDLQSTSLIGSCWMSLQTHCWSPFLHERIQCQSKAWNTFWSYTEPWLWSLKWTNGGIFWGYPHFRKPPHESYVKIVWWFFLVDRVT